MANILIVLIILTVLFVILSVVLKLSKIVIGIVIALLLFSFIFLGYRDTSELAGLSDDASTLLEHNATSDNESFVVVQEEPVETETITEVNDSSQVEQ